MLTFPKNCKTSAERTEYAYRAQELLRLLHNVMGKWYKVGIPETLWDRLPAKIQNRYPYKSQLTGAEWQNFLSTFFEPASDKIVAMILTQRALLQQSTTWEISKEDVV